MINVDFGPTQIDITEKCICEMIKKKPRRMKISSEYNDRYGLLEPNKPGNDWCVRFPFPETYNNAFDALCLTQFVGMRTDQYGRSFTYLTGTADCDEPPEEAVRCCEILGKYVAIRDCMALSFALDYDHKNGNPELPHTEVGRYRNDAKPRDGKPPTEENYKKALKYFTQKCLTLLEDIPLYKDAEGIVAMPSSDPDKINNLPRDLAKKVAKQTDIPNLSKYVRSEKRDQLKNISAQERLKKIRGTIKVEAGIFKEKSVFIIDDVYQSGVSINYVAMLLQQAGAKRIYGFACDKTSSNTDNVS